MSLPSDDSLALARDLGSLRGSRLISDTIASSDPADFYRFTLASASQFSLTLGGISAGSDLDVQLLDSSGRLIALGTNGGRIDEFISRSLAAGTYFIRVFHAGGSPTSTYNLSLNVVAPSRSLLDISPQDNSTATAIDLGVLTSGINISDAVSSSDSDDYYKFTLASAATFSLSLSGITADTDVDVQLLDAAGSLITSSSNGSNTSESITRSLTAGSYYVRVLRYSGSVTSNYNLSLSATGAAGTGGLSTGDNSLATASDLGILSSAINISDAVASSDTDDYYKFTLASAATFSLSLSGITANTDVDVQLLDAAGSLITSSSNGSNTSESITRSLTAGSYYVRVLRYSGSVTSNYNLSLSATGAAGTGGLSTADNSLAGARDLGALTAAVTISDAVASSDTDDYYKFTLPSTSNFSLSLSGITANTDTDVQLLDAAGSLITSSTNSANANESISRSLAAGTYYVRVLRYSGSATSSYTLALNATGSAGGGGVSTGDNTLATAADLGSLTAAINASDSVSSTDTDDYYKFTLPVASNFALSLTGITAGTDTDVQLLNAAGSLINSSANGGNANEAISQSLAAGTYYARVFRYSGSTTSSYNLSLNATAAAPTGALDGAGNTYAAARNLGTIATTATFNDRITAADQLDILKWRVETTGSYAIRLDQISSDLEVEITTADGTVVSSGLNSGVTPEAFSVQLAAGQDYYAKIYPFRRLSESSYSFSINRAGSSSAPGSTGGTETSRLNWNIMVYIAGDNDLAQFVRGDINEIERVTHNGFAVTGLVDLNQSYLASSLAATERFTGTRRGVFSSSDNSDTVISLTTSNGSFTNPGNLNTGNGQTLADFIQYAMTTRPAENYALVIWDHGGYANGSNEVAYDESSAYDSLSLAEVRQAIVSSGINTGARRLDAVFWDACQMASIENFWNLRDQADVVVASQLNIPGNGYNYDLWLRQLSANVSATNGYQLASQAVTAYQQEYATEPGTTLSAVRTDRLTGIQTAITNLRTSITAGSSEANAISSIAQGLQRLEGSVSRDLRAFAAGIAASANAAIDQETRTAATALATAVSNAVVANYSSVPNLAGLSAYMPAGTQAIAPGYTTGNTSPNYLFAGQTQWPDMLTII
ncbi:MAG: pre-peptidase C-terminal domain-containing protein [Cyanobium sp.]